MTLSIQEKELEKLLEKIILPLDSDAKIDISKDKISQTFQINIDSQKSGILIGRYGETLAALQFIIRLVLSNQAGEQVKAVVDVAGYKAAKAHELEELALQVAENVKKSCYPQTLRPMNPYERRIIHVALADFKGVEAVSVGEEPNRCIEVKIKK